jgi:hypothetical protein
MKKIKIAIQASRVPEVLNEAQAQHVVVCTKFIDGDMAELELFGDNAQKIIDKYGDSI